jgi:V/A-type H+-transporting ATPase subunit E
MGVYMNNGIEKIIDHIEAEAAAERAAILAEADARCEEILASYAKTAAEEYQKIVSAGAAEAQQRISRLGSTAALEAKKQVLAAKQEMVNAAFERAAELLIGLNEDRYVPLLARLAADASRTGSELLAFSPADQARVGKAVTATANELLRRAGKTANLTLSPDARSIRGGVIVMSGDIETNCSIDALVSQHRNELSGKVAEKLFA